MRPLPPATDHATKRSRTIVSELIGSVNTSVFLVTYLVRLPTTRLLGRWPRGYEPLLEVARCQFSISALIFRKSAAGPSPESESGSGEDAPEWLAEGDQNLT